MAFDSVSQAVTIATRYAAVRRQGPKDQQILDYQSQYSALLSIISGCYVLNFGIKYDDDDTLLTSLEADHLCNQIVSSEVATNTKIATSQ